MPTLESKPWEVTVKPKYSGTNPPKAQVASGHSVSRALRLARVGAGLKQGDVAKRLDVHPMTLSKWERGISVPGEDDLARLAELYDITPAALRYGNGSAQNVVRESPAADRVPLISQGLPKPVRVWLHGFLLELAEADVPDEQIESARAALTSPENFSFFVGGQPTDYTEEEILDGLKAFALHIRGVLRERGFKVKAR